ncbi:hypothetical protein [Chryseobacterium viscerum]|uniref:hypothetical protein n=1 Tax=Chryseobacterium viscerum TaxID=1037377 RepID=UPI0022224D3B|nr:hypothetical protein [Chryseobacterium viscerum]MCW1963051.1 hypothetical protein [Chryseobacterium viscerum]
MKTVNVLRIFLASPGDVSAEREMIFGLKDDLDELIGKDKDLKFEIVNWERNTYPGKGEDAQDVINKQINDEYDIFLGIFWQRFGTPTNRFESGTLEEYERAKIKFDRDSENTHILMYFKNQEVNMYNLDLEQFKKVKEFKSRIANEDGVYYSMFEKTEDLKKTLQLNLANLIRDKFSKEKKSSNNENSEFEKNTISQNYDKYDLLAQKIDDGEYSTENIDLLEDMEKAYSSLQDLTLSTNKITNVIGFFTSKTTEKTNQLEIINQIKDEKFRLIRAKKITNNYAKDLDNYSVDFENLLPEFKTSISNVIESYSELILKTIKSDHKEIKNEIIEIVPSLIIGIEGALDGVSSFLNSLIAIRTHLTSKFSTAKRRAELATNNVFKELINARKLLQQLLNDNLGDLS